MKKMNKKTIEIKLNESEDLFVIFDNSIPDKEVVFGIQCFCNQFDSVGNRINSFSFCTNQEQLDILTDFLIKIRNEKNG